MSFYDLSHLTQDKNQKVAGPIQDDEALFLYSLIKVTKLKNIVEIGGLGGYSALNFLKALDDDGIVITIDLNETPKINKNHFVIIKNCCDINYTELNIEKIDLLFFDAHDYNCQMMFFNKMLKNGKITDETIIALHDTNVHPEQYFLGYKIEEGWIHQQVERQMVNDFFKLGYSPLCLHTKKIVHNNEFPYRHGLTILSKFKELKI